MNILFDQLSFERVDPNSVRSVEQFYAGNKYKVSCGKLDLVYTLRLNHSDVRLNHSIVAAVRLVSPTQQNPSSKILLLRNLCVAKELRGQGLARHLMTKLLTESSPPIYLFSLAHLTDFYSSVGFLIPTSEKTIPVEIAQLAQTYKARKRDWVLMTNR